MANNNKKYDARFTQKHDTEENWNKASSFYPLKGEIIIYDPDENYNYSRLKVGIWDPDLGEPTLEMSVINLPFINTSTEPNEVDINSISNDMIVGITMATPGLRCSNGDVYGYDGTALNIVIPPAYAGQEITTISEAFTDSKITSVKIIDGIISIGYKAFVDCKELVSVTLPSTLQIIDDCFSGCVKLPSITFPGSLQRVEANPVGACDSLELIESTGAKGFIFGDTVLVPPTPYYAEGNCLIRSEDKTIIAACKNSIIPSDIKNIGEYAFNSLPGLKNIAIPASMENISLWSFYNLAGLESITVDTENTKYHSQDNCLIDTANKTLILGCKNSIIPDDGSVTALQGYSFCGSDITDVIIPDPIINIMAGAFTLCPNIQKLSLGAGLQYFPNNAFGVMPELETITVSQNHPSWTALNNCLISGPTETTSHSFIVLGGKTSVIPENSEITEIGEKAFYGRSITSITIPSNIASIGSFAFANSKLNSITLSEGVRYIGDSAFRDCQNLYNMTIPSTVQEIGANALHIGPIGFMFPLSFTFLSPTPPVISPYTFNTNQWCNIVVPKGCGEAYKTATNWVALADRITEAQS